MARFHQFRNQQTPLLAARIEYQDMELEAGLIVMDYSKNELTLAELPTYRKVLFKTCFIRQDRVHPRLHPVFNFDSKRALIWNLKIN